ncbi:MAG: 5-(carboxyamino)imidazole ribonucleotide mutase [Bacteroidales bacterium]|nr:5-(carboxyamino)imidazole ribonucleotide mutase [Bacteroidales bacterium]
MKVAVIMGSTSDLEVMSGAFGILSDFGIEFEKRVISAHRTPELMFEYTKALKGRGFGVVIAGAGGAAHLAGVAAGLTTLPVIAVPMATKNLGGLDSLLSMVQMPTGIPVATVAIGGAKNAAILAAEILALQDESIASKLDEYRKVQSEKIYNTTI